VQRQAALASTFYMLNEPAIQLARKIVDAAPCGGLLRYQLSGTDATFSALRIARGATGRNRVIKFEGAFHGSHDVAQVSFEVRPRERATAAVRDTLGIPERLVEEVLVAHFNDLPSVAALVEAHADEIAAIIVEPLQTRAGAASGISRRPARARVEARDRADLRRGRHRIQDRVGRCAGALRP
jgi:glutamate-1-semialdehyde 2,1-aminomutase